MRTTKADSLAFHTPVIPNHFVSTYKPLYKTSSRVVKIDLTDIVITQYSRWQAVLLEAGGLSAALGDENMRRLKYYLHCLQYATAQIDAQILLTSSGFHCRSATVTSCLLLARRPVSQAPMRTLTDVRRDLVQTIRARASKVGVTVPAATQGSRAAAGDRKRESVTAAASGSGTVRRLNRRARGARDGCRFKGVQPGAFFFA
ncbi:hypothetical protein AX14_005986 [Amanita brunnescens Koide BX004]|nr:hypothetical protein AX14_005986 [Amanita brunnescens Koide BX004]